jgi:hypothetical protein
MKSRVGTGAEEVLDDDSIFAWIAGFSADASGADGSQFASEVGRATSERL